MSSGVEMPRTVMDPASESLAGVYAQALMGLADDDAQAEALLGELDGVLELMDTIDGFQALLIGAVAGSRQRRELASRIFGGRVSPHTESFLGVLAAHGRMGLLRPIRRHMHDLLRQRRGQVEVRVDVAQPLTPGQRELIIESLRRTLGAQPVLHATVDPSLLGGVVLCVGDRRVDASLAGNLRRLRRQLMGKLAGQAARRLEQASEG